LFPSTFFSDAVREDGGLEAEIAGLMVRSDDSGLPAVTQRRLLYTLTDGRRQEAPPASVHGLRER